YTETPAARLVYGNIRVALENLGINWVPARVAWDAFNPHPDLSELPREAVFVTRGNGNQQAISTTNPATASLQEILLLYPGYILPSNNPAFTVEPLLQTGSVSGSMSFFDLARPSQQGMVLNASPEREADGRQYVLAARVRSKTPLTQATGVRPMDMVV